MNNSRSKQKPVVIITAAALVILIAVFAAVWYFTRPAAQSGAKTITVSIVNAKASNRELTIHTDAEYLRPALEQEKLIAGEESAYGFFVKTVNGYTANGDAQEWWCFTKGGESLTTGVDATPIADGDQFEITMTVGY